MGIRATGFVRKGTHMKIEETQENEITIVSLGGDIETYGAPELKQHIQLLVADGRLHLLFDMGDLDYICSAGVAVLISWSERIRSRGGVMAICGLQGDVRETFRILRLDKSTAAFQVFGSRDQALEGMKLA